MLSVGEVRNYSRAIAASFVGFAVLAAGLFGGGRRASDLVWFLLVFGAMQFVALRLVKSVRARAEKSRVDDMIAARREKAREENDTRVLGRSCAVCDRRIVVEHDGERCGDCRSPLHLGCLKEHRLAHVNATSAYR
jgi:hypothetical protein